MRQSSAILAATLVLYQSFALANPLPQYSFAGGNSEGGGACAAAANPEPEYEVTSQEQKDGAPVQISQSCSPSGGDEPECNIGTEKSFEVAVTVTVGANLNFGSIVGAGVTAEVSTSTAKGTTDTNQQKCGGPWSCSMMITPQVQEVAGTKWEWVGCPSEKKEFPYTVQFPIKSGEDLPIQFSEICQCPNREGFDEKAENAPPACPNPC